MGLCSSEGRSSQGQLLLHPPQGLGALHQLLHLVGLQRHVHDVGEAAVAQDAGDAEEDLVLHAVHALRGDERGPPGQS